MLNICCICLCVYRPFTFPLLQFLSYVHSVLDPSVTPPEDTPPVNPNQLSFPHARDIWALGQLITSIDMELGDTGGGTRQSFLFL